MEDYHARMPRACKRGRPNQAEPEKSCASKRGRRSKPVSLRELLQSSPYEAQASTSGTAPAYSTPQQGTTQQQLQQAHFTAAYSCRDPRIRREAERQHNYYTRAQTSHEHAAFLPTEQNMGLSASNQVLYPNISTATYTVPEQGLASASGQSSFPYNTNGTVNHVIQTGTSGMPNMHHMSMSSENRTSVTSNCSNNAHQIRTPTPIMGPDPMAYLNKCSQIPVTVHSRNTEQMSSPAPAAGPESILNMNRTSRTSANAPIMNTEQMSPPAPDSAQESLSYMNRASQTPVTAPSRNAEHMNSPVSAAGADSISYKNRASLTSVTGQMRSPPPAHSRNAQQMSSPVPAAGPESMSYMNRASQSPVTAHSRNAQHMDSPVSAAGADSISNKNRASLTSVTGQMRSPPPAHSRNAQQMSSPVPAAGPESMSYMNRASQSPVTAHSRNAQHMDSPVSAAGADSISYKNRASITSVTGQMSSPPPAHSRNAQQMSSPVPAAGPESMSYMNRASQSPVTAHSRNAQHMDSPVSAAGADSISYKNRASITSVTGQMSSPPPAHSRNAQQMSSPVPAAGPESISYMNRASQSPVTAHNRNIKQINSFAPAIRPESMPFATRSTSVPVTAHCSSSHTASTARPEFMAYMNRPTSTPALAHYESAQRLRYASLRPRPIRKDHKLCQTEFSMTKAETKLIKLLKNKKMNVTRIKTEMEDKELNVTYYEKPIRTDVISCIEPASNTLKNSLLRMFQLREMLSMACKNELTANENDADINNEAALPLVQLPNVEDPRYEAVSPYVAETDNINNINAENPFDQLQMPHQQINMSPPGGHQGFPIPTIYNHDFSNSRRFNPHFAGMPQSIRGPNFNIPLSFPPVNFSNYLAENFFRNNPPPVNNFNFSGWY